MNIAPSFEQATKVCIFALRDGTPEGQRMAEQELLRYARELDRLAEPAPTPEAPVKHTHLTPEQLRFVTQGIPRGYDTVLGYTAKMHPDTLVYDADIPEATVRDGYWLTHRCRERGLACVKVEAPEVLQEQGIELVNAYPVDLLQERIG